MKIRILFFAAYRELLGTGERYLDLPEPATVSDLLQELWALGEPYASLPAAPVAAVNRHFAKWIQLQTQSTQPCRAELIGQLSPRRS